MFSDAAHNRSLRSEDFLGGYILYWIHALALLLILFFWHQQSSRVEHTCIMHLHLRLYDNIFYIRYGMHSIYSTV